MIIERLKLLRNEMASEGIDAYIIPTSDYHQSEYVGEYFRVREYMSGFTGSAGILIVTQDMAGLWTDGRYFIQAEEQLKNSTIELYKSGEEGVPDTTTFLENELNENMVIGFDGRVIDISYAEMLEKKLKDKHVTLKYSLDLVDRIWTDRPAISTEPAFILDVRYTGMSAADKLSEVRRIMKEKNADYHLLTSLDDIAWLLNIRGNDVVCNPVVLAYLALSGKEACLFVNNGVLDTEVKAYMAELGVTLKDYNDIYMYAAAIPEGSSVLIDNSRLNYALLRSLRSTVTKINAPNPTILMKAKKNTIEQDNLREVHLRDGIAVTKFIYWLKKNIGHIPMTELSAAEYLENERKNQPEYIEPSFETISGYAAHGAIIHYEPTPETDIPLSPKGFLLVDSGGQYRGGTTDITRTIALGEVTETMRTHYTTVLRAALSLSSARFLEGCSGANLDILARGPFWDQHLDYKHGTGHGVGFFLNVHEGPQSFHWRAIPGRNCTTVLEEGMVITDEPGIYIEGSHGIRIENELLCRRDEKNEFGQFMNFEILTVAPIDLDAVDVSLMTIYEKAALNEYHAWVYAMLAPHLTDEEAAWLKDVTKNI